MLSGDSWAFLALALAAVWWHRRRSTSKSTSSFPRNETYKPSTVFPIALAVQNVTVMGASATSPSPGTSCRTPEAPSRPASDSAGERPVIFFDNNNVTEWIRRKQRGDRYMLNWHVVLNGTRERCRYYQSLVTGGLMFGVEADWEAAAGGDGG
ncbi:hypothetical protein TPAR_00251, partial [Tolypocladium paradoxum]